MSPGEARLRIAPMSVDDLRLTLDWAAEEGWNPGLDDAPAFHAADPGGFLMGWIGPAPVAAISVVRHSPAFAFLGLYLCRPAWRGQGIGRALWDAGLALAGDRTIGLDGVAAQQENYRRSGFVSVGRTIRFTGMIPPGPADGLASGEGLSVAAIDRTATGIDRPAFLRAWLEDTPARASLCLVRDGRVDGFGTVRRCREGAKVGPLTAVSAGDARRLLRALAGVFPDRPLVLDVPEASGPAVALAETFGLRRAFETARMYRGDRPVAQDAMTWGVATLELG